MEVLVSLNTPCTLCTRHGASASGHRVCHYHCALASQLQDSPVPSKQVREKRISEESLYEDPHQCPCCKLPPVRFFARNKTVYKSTDDWKNHEFVHVSMLFCSQRPSASHRGGADCFPLTNFSQGLDSSTISLCSTRTCTRSPYHVLKGAPPLVIRHNT